MKKAPESIDAEPLYDPQYPARQVLRVIADTWNAVFRDEFTKTERNLVFELRDTRNRWAHNDAFSLDDTYRSLDSIERLLIAIDATQASEVGRSKDELMRERYEARTRRAARFSVSNAGNSKRCLTSCSMATLIKSSSSCFVLAASARVWIITRRAAGPYGRTSR